MLEIKLISSLFLKNNTSTKLYFLDTVEYLTTFYLHISERFILEKKDL